MREGGNKALKMMRRTILVCTGFVFVALALTVGFAVFSLGGPEAAIAKAEGLLAEGESREALRFLRLAEHDLGPAPDRKLQERLLRLRIRVLLHLEDKKMALADLARLQDRLGIQDEELELLRLNMLLDYGRHTANRGLLQELLGRQERFSGSGSGQIGARLLAAEARRSLAEGDLERFEQVLASKMSARAFLEARQLLRPLVSGEPDAERAESLRTQLEELFRAWLPDGAKPQMRELQEIKEQFRKVQESLLLGLAGEKPLPVAYLGLRDLLGRNGQDDSLLLLAGIYAQRASPGGALSGIVDMAWIHLEHERYHSVIDVVDRAFPAKSWVQRLEQGSLTSDVANLILCKAMAQRELGLEKDLLLLAGQVSHLQVRAEAMPDSNVTLYPFLNLIMGLCHAGQEDRVAEDHLTAYSWNPEARSQPWHGKQLMALCWRVRNELAERLDRGRETREEIFARWIADTKTLGSSSRALTFEPHLAAARYYLAKNLPILAGPYLATAARLSPMDEKILHLTAEVAEASLAESKKSLASILERCLKLQQLVPDDIGDQQVLLLPVAELALSSGHPQITLACSQKALELYPWAKWPTHLEAEASLRLGDPKAAVRTLELVLQQDAEDARALELLSQARRAAGRKVDDLRYDRVRLGTPDFETVQQLMRQWLWRGQLERVLFLAEKTRQARGPELGVQVLAAKAQIRLRDLQPLPEMLRALEPLAEAELAGGSGSSGNRSAALWVLAQKILYNPDKLEEEALGSLLDRYLAAEDSADALLDTAESLRLKGEIEFAYRCSRRIILGEDFASQRRGLHFLACGRLAMQMGHKSRAGECFRAAMAFPDEEVALAARQELSLLQLLEDDEAGATALFTGIPIQDLATALIAGRLGQGGRALPWVRSRLEDDPDNLPALCMLAALDPEAAAPEAVAELAAADPNLLLEVLALLQDETHAPLGVALAADLVQKHPQNHVARIIQARALALAGRDAEVLPALIAAGPKAVQVPALRREALMILTRSRSPALGNSEIRDQLLDQVTAQGAEASPAMLALVLKHNPALLKAPNLAQTMLPVLARFWIRQADIAEPGLDEVDLLIEASMTREAMQLLKVIEGRLEASERGEFLERYFCQARLLLKNLPEPALATTFCQDALRILDAESPYGVTLHFVLDHRKMAGLEVDEAEDKRRLEAQIEFFLDGQDKNVRWFQASLSRLVKIEGLDKGLIRLEKILRRDPSLLEIWALRANWLRRSGRVQEAIDSLRRIPRYLDDGTVHEALMQVIGREGRLAAGEKELIDQELLQKASPFSRGLLLLRQGKYETAIDAFTTASRQEDGAELYYGAMAGVALMHEEGRKLARNFLSRLESECPDSPLSDMAKPMIEMLSR